MREHRIQIGGREELVWVTQAKGQLWFHWRGKTYCVEVDKSTRRSSKAAQVHPGVITAPMPGKVTQVLEQGQAVELGQTVVVMEAMKMEYSLKADIKGKLKNLHCQVGDQVALGKILAEIQGEE